MNSLDIAKKLNKTIISSKEYKELKEAEERVLSNIRSKTIFKSYIEKQKQLENAIENKLNNKVNKIRLELIDIYDRVEANENLCLLMESLNNFMNFKERIMQIIDANIRLDSEIYMLKTKKNCNKKCGGCK